MGSPRDVCSYSGILAYSAADFSRSPLAGDSLGPFQPRCVRVQNPQGRVAASIRRTPSQQCPKNRCRRPVERVGTAEAFTSGSLLRISLDSTHLGTPAAVLLHKTGCFGVTAYTSSHTRTEQFGVRISGGRRQPCGILEDSSYALRTPRPLPRPKLCTRSTSCPMTLPAFSFV